MKKIVSILVALALVLGLSVVATPVLAKVTPADVVPSPTDQFKEAKYTVTFNITGDLIGGTTTITVEFPTGTVLPAAGQWSDGHITVNGHDVPKAWVSVSARKVTFYSPKRVDAPGPVEVVFKEGFGIKNPAAGTYNLWVNTSTPVDQTPEKSKDYVIGLADHSTYEFVVDKLFVNQKQVMVFVGEPVKVDVTLRTLLEGLAGYDNVQKQIKLVSAPSSARVELKIGTDTIPLTSVGQEMWWGDTFNITKSYNEKWVDATMEFDRVGIYTIELRLRAADTVLVKESVSVTVAGVSEVVELNKGWNLMSLPIVPDNSAIATVLAGIGTNWQTKVASVWYYDPTIVHADPNQKWRRYAPPPAPAGTPPLTKIEDGKAYWINMNVAANLTVVGVAFVLPGEVPPTYSVREGWNMVGFKSLETNITAGVYLEGTDLVRVLQFKNGEWTSLGKTDPMTPGLGYWVAFSKAGVIYP